MKTIRRNRNARKAIKNFVEHNIRQTEIRTSIAIAKAAAAKRDGLMAPEAADLAGQRDASTINGQSMHYLRLTLDAAYGGSPNE